MNRFNWALLEIIVKFFTAPLRLLSASSTGADHHHLDPDKKFTSAVNIELLSVNIADNLHPMTSLFYFVRKPFNLNLTNFETLEKKLQTGARYS